MYKTHRKKTIILTAIIVFIVSLATILSIQPRKLSSKAQQQFQLLESSILSCIKSNNYEQAAYLGEKSINFAQNKFTPTEYHKLLILTGYSFYHLKQYNKAAAIYQRLAEKTQDMPNHQLSIYYLYKGMLLQRQGHLKKAANALQKAVKINDQASINRVFTVLATTYLDLHKDDEALSVLQQKLSYTQKTYGVNSEEVAESYFWLARAYLLMKKIAKAKTIFHKCISILSKCQSDRTLVVMAYLNLADIAEIYDKDKVLALDFLQKAFEVNSLLAQPIKEQEQPIKSKIKKIKLELQAKP
ncbi:MAG: tetratricopeptide repeat protein [Lentisphaerae bacterium]|nr:tetratricopeptide repeat protein [Lentisphaerota bacterium]MCP4103810.1 tetratricopeptide repeat protein [Lentisphaerota bacterium]